MIENATLYVEKYSCRDGELLLDFIKEDEFICFQNNGANHWNYDNDIHLSNNEYEPTMLLVYNCFPNRRIEEGSIIVMSMNKLLDLKGDGRESHEDNDRDVPATVSFEFFEGHSFATLVDDSGYNYLNSHEISEYETKITSSWANAPRALEQLKDSFELRIWDVGQGNTNSIYDETNLVLFDFGASIYYPKKKLKSILCSHSEHFKNRDTTALIISHWDVDHFNLLCVVSDEWLNQVSCIYCPSHVIGLTAKQIANRVVRSCEHVRAIEPVTNARKWCSITNVVSGERYALFSGEASSDKNKSGLLLAVNSREENALLTSDHSSYQVWSKLYGCIGSNQKKTHVVVPHHGGNCGSAKIKGNHPGIAVVSVGSNGYGHPLKKVIDEYRNAKYTIKQTDHLGDDIVIEMK